MATKPHDVAGMAVHDIVPVGAQQQQLQQARLNGRDSAPRHSWPFRPFGTNPTVMKVYIVYSVDVVRAL